MWVFALVSGIAIEIRGLNLQGRRFDAVVTALEQGKRGFDLYYNTSRYVVATTDKQGVWIYYTRGGRLVVVSNDRYLGFRRMYDLEEVLVRALRLYGDATASTQKDLYELYLGAVYYTPKRGQYKRYFLGLHKHFDGWLRGGEVYLEKTTRVRIKGAGWRGNLHALNTVKYVLSGDTTEVEGARDWSFGWGDDSFFGLFSSSTYTWSKGTYSFALLGQASPGYRVLIIEALTDGDFSLRLFDSESRGQSRAFSDLRLPWWPSSF